MTPKIVGAAWCIASSSMPRTKVLLFHSEGQLTDESLAAYSRTIRKNWIATGAEAGIWDFSAVTEFSVSTDFIRWLARQEPTLAHASRARVIIASDAVGFGLSRMFQLAGEPARPLLHVVRTLNEALAVLKVEFPKFEPLE
jgi:hypothetical protein